MSLIINPSRFAVAGGGGGLAIVQSKSSSALTASTKTSTFDSTATSGNLIISIANGIRTTTESGIAVPTGFTEVLNSETVLGPITLYFVVGWKVSDGTETGIAVTISGYQVATAHFIVEVSGADTSSPIDNSGVYTDSLDGEVALPGVSTTAADTLLLYSFSFADGNYSGISFNNSFTQLADFETIENLGPDISAALASRIVSSAGTEACTMSATSGGDEQNGGAMIAIKQAS
jgi:hypothetical protein